MADSYNFRSVLCAYAADCQPQSVEFLDTAGGFSGARLWRLTAPRGQLCLRRWPPEHPTPNRLEFIQAVLWHVHQEGFDRVPLPVETLSHAGYVRHEDHLWELTPWFDGTPEYAAAPNPRRRAAAMQALAAFHRAAESFPIAEAARCQSPGIVERHAQLVALVSGGFERLRSAVAAACSASRAEHDDARCATVAGIIELFPRAAPRVQSLLAQAVRLDVQLAPCLRDIWADNVLFVGDEVTGIVDVGAMRPENVAADVARLLGSLAEDDRAAWKAALAAYEEIRPLSEVEAILATAFDASGVLLGGINWLSWLYLDRRTFAQPARVQARLEYFRRRLSVLAHDRD